MPEFSGGQLDDAMLRQVFTEVATDHAAWLLNPMIPWKRLYDVVMETEAGGVVLQYIAQLEADVERLQHKVDSLSRLGQAPEVK